MEEIIRIPEGTIEIEDYAFSGNESIREVHIPDSIHRLGRRSFEGCHSLEKVVFGKLEDSALYTYKAFSDCPNLKEVHFPDWVSFWNYKSDGADILTNGTYLYIDGQRVSEVVITPNTWDFMNLDGIRNKLNRIVFDDGTLAVCYYGGICRESTFDDFKKKYKVTDNDLKILIDLSSEPKDFINKGYYLHIERNNPEKEIVNRAFKDCWKIKETLVTEMVKDKNSEFHVDERTARLFVTFWSSAYRKEDTRMIGEIEHDGSERGYWSCFTHHEVDGRELEQLVLKWKGFVLKMLASAIPIPDDPRSETKKKYDDLVCFYHRCMRYEYLGDGDYDFYDQSIPIYDQVRIRTINRYGFTSKHYLMAIKGDNIWEDEE